MPDQQRTLIRGGLVVDGTGGVPYVGDVLLAGDRILAVGPSLTETADTVIDAAGCAVCPGFVDIHRHLDAKAIMNWGGETELRQGITSTVVGNCGFSLAPNSATHRAAQRAFDEPILGPLPEEYPTTFPAYLSALSSADLPLNVGAMIGAGSVRISEQGFVDAPLTGDAMRRAQDALREALTLGAAGVSLGIMYLPEYYADRAELAEMLRPLGEMGGLAVMHIRGEGDSLVASVQEALDITAMAGCSLHISHFKSCGVDNWRREIHKAIALIEQARAQGRDVTCDFYPYTGGSTGLNTMLPPSFVAGDMEKALARLGTPQGVQELRNALEKRYDDWDNYAISLGWERILISSVKHPHNKKYLGRNVEQAAKAEGCPDAVALAAHLLHDEQGATAIINMSMCQDDVDTIARLPYAMVISDAIYADTPTPHPRLFGAMPRVLRDMVAERNVLDLPTAIHKMTALPAWRMGLQDRGTLAPGYMADVLVFDPDQFRDNATFEDPAQLATGLVWSFINGIPVVRDDHALTGSAGRRLLRGA